MGRSTIPVIHPSCRRSIWRSLWPSTPALLVPLASLAAQQPDAASRYRTPAPATTVPPSDTAPKVSFDGFIDSYYAWDVNQPYNFDRAYTTQPARHAEFNINLAFFGARLAGPRYRGRLAIQFGTSVQANYAGEPHIGGVSGPSVSQFLQEASIGYQLAPALWIDGGIFFAHTGYEGWVTRDNLAYSRSLIADFSPYYEAGVKLTWTPSSAVTAQLTLVNGWQDISKYNTPPAVGVRVDYMTSPAVTLSYDNFVGNVAPDSVAAELRFYNDFIALYSPSARWQFAAAVDVGLEGRSTANGGTATWWGTSVFAKYHATPKVGVVARLERYADAYQVIVRTGLPDPFRTSGVSLGVDVAPVARVLWRTEVRALRSDDRVWPTHQKGVYARADGFVVTSLALTL
jgi:hypothetical protein